MLKIQTILAAAMTLGVASQGADLRIGLIGCDTSHSTVFTETFNNPDDTSHIAGGKVVAVVKAGSPDVKDSATRVDGYAKQLKEKFGVQFYDSIEEMCSNVDAVLLESVDGRAHLPQFKSILHSGRNIPVFIDKPIAASLSEAQEIFRLAKEANVPVFSCSSIRFGKTTQDVVHGSIGKVLFAETYAPVHIEPHHPELYYYGVHGVEALCTALGPGCESVQRRLNPEGKIEVVGTWSGGRIGIFREEKDDRYYFGVARGEKGVAVIGTEDRYTPLLVQIMRFFQTREVPVKPEETLEVMAFMTAADESKNQNGAQVNLKELMPR
jgi:predicted dehydrogenase